MHWISFLAWVSEIASPSALSPDAAMKLSAPALVWLIPKTKGYEEVKATFFDRVQFDDSLPGIAEAETMIARLGDALFLEDFGHVVHSAHGRGTSRGVGGHRAAGRQPGSHLGLGHDEIQDAYGPIYGIPASFLISRDGKVWASV